MHLISDPTLPYTFIGRYSVNTLCPSCPAGYSVMEYQLQGNIDRELTDEKDWIKIIKDRRLDFMHTEDIEHAKKARYNACCKYSNFQVGSALRTKNGKIYVGCNIENHGIQGICAERTAFAKALSEGEREFESITIVGGKTDKELEKCMPCGYCRQFMSEYVDKDFKIYVLDENNNVEEFTINELLPHSFKF